jgi:hypothetical protein
MRLMSEQGTVQPTSFRLSGGLSNQLFVSAEVPSTQGHVVVPGFVKFASSDIDAMLHFIGDHQTTYPPPSRATTVA